MTYNTITVLDVDLVLPARHRDRLIRVVAGYTELNPADLDVHDTLALLGLRGVEYTTARPVSAATGFDLALFSTSTPAAPWITYLIPEHPDLFLTNDDVRAGDPYVAGSPARVCLPAARHSSQIQDQTELAGGVPFIVYRDDATEIQTVMLVRIDEVHPSSTVERTVITETFDPEAWYEPFIAENGN